MLLWVRPRIRTVRSAIDIVIASRFSQWWDAGHGRHGRLFGFGRDGRDSQETLAGSQIESQVGTERVSDFAGALATFGRSDLRVPSLFPLDRPEAPPLEYPGPPPFLPLTPQDIPFQIGILRPFYLEKVAQARAQAQAASENAEADQGLGLHADSDSKMDVDLTANALADQEWDPTMTQLGAFGQVVVRGVGAGGKKPQDKKEERKAKRAKNRGAAG